ncbi:MAG: glycosyltransferase family 2 protein [candidate division Zixibacteria bacterium]|nr:glycosyltransferase family 2 protein [candidate division Zixibacteria bacterium]
MSAASPVISAIVIAYNGAAFLPSCLRTLLADLTGIESEVIVVDNGSSDGSADLVSRDYPDVQLIRNGENLGFTAAVNIGLKTARGSYLYILNQDLEFSPGSTRLLLDRLRREPEVGLIGPAFVDRNDTVMPSVRSFPTYRHVVYVATGLSRLLPTHREFSSWKMGWFDHQTERYVDQPMGAAMLVPRPVIDRVGLLDEQFPIFFSDVDFCKRIHDVGYRLLYYPAARVFHHVGGSTRRQPARMRVESHRSMYRYLRKYARWYQLPCLWLAGVLLYAGILPAALGLMDSPRSSEDSSHATD